MSREHSPTPHQHPPYPPPHNNLNLRHPGWPAYAGPTAAWCLFPHHDTFCAWCPDIPERWQHILSTKLPSQIPQRAAHFIVLEEEEVPLPMQKAWKAWEMAREKAREAGKARKTAWEELKKAWKTGRKAGGAAEKTWDKAWKAWEKMRDGQEKVQKAWETAYYEAQPALEALLAHYVPDHCWNGKEIVFP